MVAIQIEPTTGSHHRCRIDRACEMQVSFPSKHNFVELAFGDGFRCQFD